MTETKNLTESNRDYSVFLPSISGFYAKMIAAQRNDPNYLSTARIPDGFEYGVDGCDFLKPNDTYYSYKWGLYSAGHAVLDTAKSDEQESMIQKRDRNTSFILGDSGGFQIAKGVIQCDWPNFKKDDSLRSKILNWLEHTSDYSMVLDIPTLASVPPLNEKTGLKSFADCLDYTMFNNDYFVRNRQGKTKFMNVLQGNDEHTADIWYDAVKHYPFEGWAMAGYNMRQLHLMLRRLIVLRDEKLLDPGRDLIHYLGTAKLDWACVFTAIQRNLRTHVNENMMVTFDAASPFITTAKGQMYTNFNTRNEKFNYIMEGAIDDKRFAGSKTPFPFQGPIADRLTMGDICWYAPGMTNKLGKEGKTSWDSFSYFLLMAHNVYTHINAVQHANKLVDVAKQRYSTDHRHWHKTKPGKAELDSWVPRDIIYIVNFIDELFKSETPMQMLEEAQPMLASFSGEKSLKTSTASFNSLFELDDAAEFDEDSDAAEEFLENLM